MYMYVCVYIYIYIEMYNSLLGIKERNRNWESSNVGERTAWELYYTKTTHIFCIILVVFLYICIAFIKT